MIQVSEYTSFASNLLERKKPAGHARGFTESLDVLTNY